MWSPRLALVPLLVALAAASARAEPRTSVTLEPLYLPIGMVAATVEVQPAPHLGLAADLGAGRFPVGVSSWMYDLGGHANVYLTREFSGWHLGAELYYLWGRTSGDLVPFMDSTHVEGSATERIVGVYGGYKWLTRRGFTAVVQYGVGRIDATSSSDAPMSKLIPVANLTLGWSF